jgi:2-hydroxychromene-2-carboxylate isomerase
MIDFWVSVGSPCSYLSVSRLKGAEAAHGVTFRWRPFSVRAIAVEQNDIPFAGAPVRLAYMWRDIERRARCYGLAPRLPAPYPLKEFDLANKIAVLAESEGWCADYVRAAYRRWFEMGQEPGVEPGLGDALRELGRDPARVVASAQTGRIEERYKRDTEEAKALGVFDSPTFVVDGEVFWGDDRLEDAIRWFKTKAPAADERPK